MNRITIVTNRPTFDTRTRYYEQAMDGVYEQIKALEDWYEGHQVVDEAFTMHRDCEQDALDAAKSDAERTIALQRIAAWAILQLVQWLQHSEVHL